MSVQAISLALKTKGLTVGQKFVLVALANYADQELKCWPSQATLASDTCQSERHVRNALKILELEGYLMRRKRRQGQRQATDLFQLRFQPEQASASEAQNTSQAEHGDLSGGTRRHSQAEHSSAKPSIEPLKNLKNGRARDPEGRTPVLVDLPNLRRAFSSKTPTETPAQMAERIRRSAG